MTGTVRTPLTTATHKLLSIIQLIIRFDASTDKLRIGDNGYSDAVKSLIRIATGGSSPSGSPSPVGHSSFCVCPKDQHKKTFLVIYETEWGQGEFKDSYLIILSHWCHPATNYWIPNGRSKDARECVWTYDTYRGPTISVNQNLLTSYWHAAHNLLWSCVKFFFLPCGPKSLAVSSPLAISVLAVSLSFSKCAGGGCLGGLGLKGKGGPPVPPVSASANIFLISSSEMSASSSKFMVPKNAVRQKQSHSNAVTDKSLNYVVHLQIDASEPTWRQTVSWNGPGACGAVHSCSAWIPWCSCTPTGFSLLRIKSDEQFPLSEDLIPREIISHWITWASSHN